MQNLTWLIASTSTRCQPPLAAEAARALADAIAGEIRAHFTLVPLEKSEQKWAERQAAKRKSAEQGAAERRRESRTLVIKAATLVFNNGNCTMDCQILDLSKNGARLKHAGVPEQIHPKAPPGAGP